MRITDHLIHLLRNLYSGQEEQYKKDLNDPDNHDGVVTHPHLEPDILKCEVKWTLGSITTNKASGGDGIPVELFQILKDDAGKVLHSICHKFGKLTSDHRTIRMFKLPYNSYHFPC